MMGVLSNGKFGYHRGELAKNDTDALDGWIKPGGF